MVRRYINRKVTHRPDPLEVARGQIKVKFQFFQKLVEFGIRLIRKLLLLYVVRRYRNWKVSTVNPPTLSPRGFSWVK